MKVYLNRISGIEEAISTMFLSRRRWSRELEENIFNVCSHVLNRDGSLVKYDPNINGQHKEDFEQFHKWFASLLKWGRMHTTMLRFIDISVSVEGLHRAGQDDWDSHAKRFDNRIIRNSTRFPNSEFKYELSDYYKGLIIPTDVAAKSIGIEFPETIAIDGMKYVKAVNGYILEGCDNDPDVKRGLYMMSIPSNFVFKVNLAEWAHVYKMRNSGTNANPEVRRCCEMIADQLGAAHKELSRELFLEIQN